MTGVANASQVAMLSVLRRWIGGMHPEELVALWLLSDSMVQSSESSGFDDVTVMQRSYFDEGMDFLGIAK